MNYESIFDNLFKRLKLQYSSSKMKQNSYCSSSSLLSYNCQTIYLSRAASMITTVSSGLSAIGSITMLSVISRSQLKLTSVYHRIMFMTGVMDIISSTASLLTTIPMPVDQIYPFEGFQSRGNMTTCEIQGFARLFGTGCSFIYNCGLVFFYLCILRLKMRDETIRKCVEPTIHVISWLIPLVSGVSQTSIFTIHYTCLHACVVNI